MGTRNLHRKSKLLKFNFNNSKWQLAQQKELRRMRLAKSHTKHSAQLIFSSARVVLAQLVMSK